jgi:GrpB-like predicted nucleotidyltransferase (UPF0157 family)
MPEDAADRDAYLDAVLVGGRERVPVVVVDYDDAWPRRYAEIRAELAPALAGTARRIAHIGSTAVPGLAAKPVIDVVVTVDDPDDEAAFAPPLQAAGYVLRVREPGHRMFRTPARDVHVHVYRDGAPEVRDYLDLRDWLRESAEDRALYAATKRRLARREWSDRNHYADAKTDVVLAILGRARAWRAAG